MMATDEAQAPTQTAVLLPSGPEIERWITRTRQERDALKARAERVRQKFEPIRQKFEPIRKELAGIERSIKVLDHFLAQVAVEGAQQNVTPIDGGWASRFRACVGCGTTERRHLARGYCTTCYGKRDQLAAAGGRE